MIRVGDVLEAIDQRAPFRTAAAWDAVGLQIGDHRRQVSTAAVVHEVTALVTDRILAEQFDLVVTYHPLVFRPLHSITAVAGPEGRSYVLAEGGVTVISVHTNWDAAAGGTADSLATALRLEDTEGFAAAETAAGEQVRMGRCGWFAGDTRDLLRAIRQGLDARPRFAGLRNLNAPKVAVLPGSGGSHVEDAVSVDADIYLTGDVSHHEVLRALDQGMAVVDAGHGPTERPGVRALYSLVEEIVDVPVDLLGIGDDPWEVQWNG